MAISHLSSDDERRVRTEWGVSTQSTQENSSASSSHDAH